MKAGGTTYAWLAAILAAAFAWGAIRLLALPFSTGDFYPEYSSLRTDPLGTKLLYDGLSRLPGLVVMRGYQPLDFFQEQSTTLLLLGTRASSLDDSEFLDTLSKIARRANRVVAALSYSESAPQRADEAKRNQPLALESDWHVRLARDGHRFYFAAADGWTVLDRRGPQIAAIEKAFDQGAVVLFASSDAFANESMVMGEHLPLVTAALGPNSHIWFDETHLGIAESGSMMGLARRYHLMGFALGLAVCAALALWKCSSPFPAPSGVRERHRTSGRTSFSGLATLLSRYVPPRELAAACWQEWLKANRRQLSQERAESAAAIAREQARRPLEAVRAIYTVVQSKGTS
jgi:hypothetical protein